MINKKIMVLALILVSLLTISCVSAAEDGNDALNTISVDGIDDEQVAEASVDDAELEAAEENNNLQLSPEDFNVTFYGDTFEVESDAKLLRFYWPDEVPVNDELVIDATGEWGYPHTYFRHDGETFVDVPFNEMYIFDPEIIDITVKYGDMEIASKTITVIKELGPNNFLEIYSKDISNSSDYITNVYDSYNGDKGLDGNVTVYADDVLVYNEVFTGTGVISKKITTDDLNTALSGEKTVVVTYQRTANGKSYTKNAIINFISDEPAGPVDTDIYFFHQTYNKKNELDAILSNKKTSQGIEGAEVVITVDGQSYNIITNYNGYAVLSLADFGAGNYTATAFYAGSGDYNPSSASLDFEIRWVDTSIECNYEINYETMYVTLVDDTNWPITDATVVVNFNNYNYTKKTDEYGSFELRIGKLAIGQYTATAYYAGDKTHNPTTTVYDFVVEGNTGLYLGYYEYDRELTVTLTDNAWYQPISDAEVIIGLGGNNYTLITDSEGYATMNVPNMAPGIYTATASYAGEGTHDPAFASCEVAINKIDTSISAVYTNDEIVATLTNDATAQVIKNANVRFIFNDVRYTVKTDSKGQARLSKDKLDSGAYTVTVSYDGNSKYNPSSASVDVSVKLDVGLSLDFNNGAREVVATLTNGATGQAIKNANLRFEVNGVKSTVKTDANGQAKVSVADLALGTYEATVNYLGNSKYNPSTIAVDFTITKIMTAISQYYDEATQELVATLINSETGQAIKGATIVFNYNGVKTSAKTDKLGQARLYIGAPSADSASLSYGGNSKYLKSYASIKLATDKIPTVISNFYYKETQEVVATLINWETGQAIKGATVVFNFNGVKTALKTDKLGQVKLSVADLVPDEYYISSSYGGNSKYAGSVARISFVKI